MQILDRDTIITRMIQTVRANTSAITYFGPGPFRSFLYAVGTELQHLYYRMFQVEQRLDVLSASGSALDSWAAGRGLSRDGASSASVVLNFTAPATISGTGTLSISGNVVTGVGTVFTTQCGVNDIIVVNGFSYLIQSITSDLQCTVVAGVNVTSPTAFQITKAQVAIPMGSTPIQVSSSTGSTFSVTEDFTMLPMYTGAPTLVGTAIAMSTGTGSSQNVPAGTINTIVNPSVVPLITLSVTNNAPAQGAIDSEDDATFRSRITTLFAGLNQGTRQFYESQVRQALPRVTRTYVARGSQLNEIVVFCATRDGSPLTIQEKQSIANTLANVTPVQTFVTIQDMTYLPINVSFSTTLTPGSTANGVAVLVAQSYASFLNWSTWPFETAVASDDLLRIANSTPGVDEISIPTFTPATDTTLLPATLPKVGTITVTDITTGQSQAIANMTNQYPRIS